MERVVLAAVPFLLAGLVLSLPLLLMSRESPPLAIVTVQLSVLVVLGLALAFRLSPLAGDDWFLGRGWSTVWRLTFSGASVVVVVTGVVALVTLASSAALRYPPSLQFLQLLSAMDIAWVAAAVVVGADRAWGRVAAAVGGVIIGVACVAAIWRYLDVVGFGPDGEWVVDGAALWRIVIPADMVAAAVAVGVFGYGARRFAQAIEQARPQS
jgi:hypothetical protein